MKQLISFTFFLLLTTLLFAQRKETLTVHFDFNKADLTPGAIAKLDSFSNRITVLSVASVQLNGYCDSKGSNEYNNSLSLRRVNTVKGYLENHDSIKASYIIATGFGENGLLNSDLTDEESNENRRVEITVTLREQQQNIAPEIKKDTRSLTTILEDTTVKKGSLIALQNLEFENSSDVLLSKSIPTLQELYDVLVKNPKMVIAIEGHICCVVKVEGLALEQYPSFTVSVMRAKKVWSYLLDKGIDPARLSYKGFGNTRPIYAIPEKSEEERTANRRVEIRIVEK